MTIGKKIEILRRSRGYSQQSLADTLRVSQGLVGNWVSGKNTPKLPQLVGLSQALGVPIDYLANEGDERSVEEVAIELKVREVAAMIGWETLYRRAIMQPDDRGTKKALAAHDGQQGPLEPTSTIISHEGDSNIERASRPKSKRA